MGWYDTFMLLEVTSQRLHQGIIICKNNAVVPVLAELTSVYLMSLDFPPFSLVTYVLFQSASVFLLGTVLYPVSPCLGQMKHLQITYYLFGKNILLQYTISIISTVYWSRIVLKKMIEMDDEEKDCIYVINDI